MNVPWILCHQCPFLLSEPQLTSASPVNPPRPIGRSGPGFCGVTGLSRFSGAHGILCVPFKSAVSVCPSTRGLLTFRGKCSGSSYSQFQTPRLGRVTWGSELSFLWGNHCNVIVFQPGGTSGKKSVCQCRRPKRHGFSTWVGKILWRKAWQSTLVFLPGESYGQGSLAGYGP